MKHVLIIFLCTFVSLCKCEKCPELEGMKDFDLKKFTGDWYVVEADPEDEGDDLKCGKEKVTLTGSRILNYEYTYFNLTTNKLEKETYTMTLNKETNDAIFTADVVDDGEEYSFKVSILDTDYDNYAVFWMCIPIDEDTVYTIPAIESRQKILSDDLLKKAYDVLDKNKVDRKNMKKIVQDCDF